MHADVDVQPGRRPPVLRMLRPLIDVIAGALRAAVRPRAGEAKNDG
jgi:hypothetical protein